MSLSRVRKPTLIVLSLLLTLAVLSFAPQPAAPASRGNAIALAAPSFVQVANAQEGTSAQEVPAAAPMGFPQDEAGISAYFKSASPVNLADVRGVYRVIEVQTADYIIGSVPVPDWWEAYDVHLYVHRDGWFLAYYLNADPVGKIIDWRRYNGAGVPTKLEKILALAANNAGTAFPGATLYDFRYPNATHMMLIVEDSSNGNTFQVNLPGTFAYYARSWSLVSWPTYNCGGTYAAWDLDGTRLVQHGGGYEASEGNIAAALLLPDTLHSFSLPTYCTAGNGALALIYRVP